MLYPFKKNCRKKPFSLTRYRFRTSFTPPQMPLTPAKQKIFNILYVAILCCELKECLQKPNIFVSQDLIDGKLGGGH